MRLIIISILAFFFTSFSASTNGYKIGDQAEDFSLMNVDGEMVSMADYEDKRGFIVIFTCNHCPYAKAYEDRIIALQTKYDALGFQVIAINPNDPEVNSEDSYANMKIRAQEKGFNFPYLFDEGQHVFPKYGATKTPHVFVIDRGFAGNSIKYIGAIDDNYEDASAVNVKYVENAVDAIIAGTEVAVKETKAIGCGIKVKK